MIESTMDGQPYQAGRHAATLRRYLWREHLGLLHAQPLDSSKDPNAQPPYACPNDPVEGAEYDFVADPLGNKLWDLWTSRATKNTEMYRQVFRADPDENSKCNPESRQAGLHCSPVACTSWPSMMINSFFGTC